MGFEKSRQAFAELSRSLDEAANHLETVTTSIEESLEGEPLFVLPIEDVMAGKALQPETIKMFLGE